MGYSLYLVAATFLAAQDLDVVLVEPQEPVKQAPAKVQPKAKEDGKTLPSAACCEGGACGDGVVCCTTGCCGVGCDNCGSKGLLARLFSRGCGQRSGLFSFLRRDCCDDCNVGCDPCDPCGSGGRRGLFGRRRCCEDMVMDACCRGMCCDINSQSCSSRRGLFGFLRRGCNDGCCNDACNICCDPCGSCCNQRQGLFGRFRRGCNDGCGNMGCNLCCDPCGSCCNQRQGLFPLFRRGCNDGCGNMGCSTCGSCSACGSCGNSCGSERRILGIFSRCGSRLPILRRFCRDCNNKCTSCGANCGQASTCGKCGADQPGKIAPKSKASLNGTQPGLFARLGNRMDGMFHGNGKPEAPADQPPFAVPHTALRMPKGNADKTEVAKKEPAKSAQDFQRIAVVNPIIETPRAPVPGQMGIGTVALFTAAEAQQVSRNVEARPAIQLVAGIKPTSTRTAHDVNYRWITGELQRYDGVWVLRYAASDSMDPFGGCAVLFPEVEMNGFREGDIVSVRGDVINSPGRGIRAAHYRATAVELIER